MAGEGAGGAAAAPAEGGGKGVGRRRGIWPKLGSVERQLSWDPHVGSSPGEDGNRELAVFVKEKKT